VFTLCAQDRMTYRAKRSDGAFVEVDQATVQEHMVNYKKSVLFRKDRVALNGGERFGGASADDTQLIVGFLCPDLGLKASLGKIFVVVRHYALDALFLALDPQDLHGTFHADQGTLCCSRIDVDE